MIDSSGRFINGGSVETSGNFLKWWNRINIQQGIDDRFIEIDASLEKRPDLIARQFIGRESAMWLVLQYNNIIDIETELLSGTIIRLPSGSRTLNLISSR